MASTTGLAFRKFDLHVHTGASKDYSGSRETCAQDIVEAALKADLAAIAITDHNTTSGIDAVRAAAKKTPLRTFPGVELTIGDAHMHVVGLFGPETPVSHINTLLARLELKNAGTDQAYCDCTVDKAINTITSEEFGGLAVLAHSDSSSGVLHDMKNAARIGVIRNWRLLAVEANNVEKTREYLDGTDPNYMRKLAVYQASDNPTNDGTGGHCAEAVGCRYSLFKVDDAISLDSLRLCFGDPDVRIRQPEEYKPGELPRLESVNIESGMLDGEAIDFHPGLNCVLGAKGAGKSVLIELLRFALEQPSTIESVRRDHERKLESKLGPFGRVTVSFVDGTGKPFTVTRTYNPVENDALDPYTGIRPARVLPIMFLSQNEIVKIAESEPEQLAFIDRFFDVGAYQETIRSIEEELEKWDRELAQCIQAQVKVASLKAEIAKLAETEEGLSKKLGTNVFASYRAAEAKKAEVTRQHNHAKTLRESLQQESDSWARHELRALPDSLRKDPALQRIQASISALLAQVAQSKEQLVASAAKAQQAIAAEWTDWKPRYEETKAEFESHVKEFGGDEKQLALQREQIAARINQLRAQMDGFAVAASNTQKVSAERKAKLESLFDAHHRRHLERVARCERFVENSGGRLRIDVHESTNAEAFKQALLKMKKGSYVSDNDIATLCSKLPPKDIIWHVIGYAIAASAALPKLAQASGLPLQKVTRLADVLLEQYAVQDLLKFQYEAFPEDRPEIRLVQPNGTEVLLKDASGGQKCTAMLLMALCDDSMPVIIDQPEDSLDNRTVWDDVCLKLRQHKDHRQFILATHNSSLAVASDTDKYIVLEETSAEHAKAVLSGAMDNPGVKDQVIKYLEGGEDTYLHKFAKYALQRT